MYKVTTFKSKSDTFFATLADAVAEADAHGMAIVSEYDSDTHHVGAVVYTKMP